LAMGVKIKMVTGDALAIAKETAKKLDMGTNILDAASLGDSKKEESAEVAESIEKADGFAQVFPEHKFHIVDVLQKRGHMVGMTGDGVNDAPALKKADCGIAVSGATDAARAAAAIVLTTPGLLVIIDAIKESRRIFQRMNSYAIYRIAETLRVLLFMTAAILIFNFYPLTAVMIVMLALLNDGAILSIAYDNVHYKDKPEAWNMRLVLGIASVLGIVGPIAAFGLFYLGDRVFHMDRPHLQPMMYLMLSVAGHLTIFLTRTRGAFWSIRPAKILWMAVLGTQIIATLIAVYGFLMPPLGWGWAGFVWAYALVWFLVSDRIKLLAYRIFDPVKRVGTKPETKVESQSDATSDVTGDAKTSAKPEAKDEDKADPKPEIEAGPKPDVHSTTDTKIKAASDLTPQIAARAYELYERQGYRDGQSAQNWDKAEQEIRATQAKGEPKAEIKPEAKTKSAPEVKAPATPEATTVPPSTVKAEPKPELKADAKPTSKVEPKPDGKMETRPEPDARPVVEVSPQLVKRVHKFYEELGRQDVQAVEALEKAEKASRKDDK
ncbi:MAG TPA: HAD-IC family P-type ATPase, partial [Verrucomicrobiae bacterium]|nr:HAD-IC family P-type ATPase [Verrucomicrobiae bacterium]